MTARRLGPSDYRRMPWKNGGGETVEIAVWPPGAGLDAFDWRISLAGVHADGPFSLFPGIDRTLSVVAGKGIDLVFGDGPVTALTADDPPYAFAADIPVSGRLHDGPITDLNVMSRRGRFAHRVTRLAAVSVLSATATDKVLVYSHDGGAIVGNEPVLGPGQCLVLSGETTVTPGRSDATFAITLRAA